MQRHTSARCRLRLLLLVLLISGPAVAGGQTESDSGSAPVASILLYHRFVPSAAERPPPDAERLARRMTTSIEAVTLQVKYLRETGHTIVPLRQIVEALSTPGTPGRPGTSLPPKAVAITVDDGHRSIHSDLLPLVERERIPVPLFIYPSAISNADWALTWEQLARLRDSGLFEIHSHTYWHPDFRQEKEHLTPAAYQDFVHTQLVKSRQEIRRRLSTPSRPVEADMLAWTFGTHDAELMAAARNAGYVAAFTTDERAARGGDNLMALPRYLMFEYYGPKRLANLIQDEAH